MKLLLSQKNQLFDIISEHGFSPRQFSYRHGTPDGAREEVVNVVFDEYDDYRFILQDYDGSIYRLKYSIIFTPGRQEFSTETAASDWQSVCSYFSEWIQNLKRETRAVDKWTTLEEMAAEVSLVSGSNDNGRFSVQEYRLLEQKMRELKGAIPTLNISAPQMEQLSEKLDKLIEHAAEMKKLDWQNLFIGTIITFALEQGLQKVDVHELWQLIKQIFSGMFLLTN